MKKTYEDKGSANAVFLSPEDAKTQAWASGLFWTIVRVALCAAAVAVLVLSHFYVWMVPVLQVTGAISLIVIAAINIDRFVRK